MSSVKFTGEELDAPEVRETPKERVPAFNVLERAAEIADPEYDTPPWHELRNQKLMEWIGDEHAVRFVQYIGVIAEFFDDLIDRDQHVTDERIIQMLFTILTEMPVNPFWDRYKLFLNPLFVTGINAWLDANALEKGDANDQAVAYVLRDWHCEFITYVIYLTRGPEYMREVSMDVRKFLMHGESLEDYREGLEK